MLWLGNAVAGVVALEAVQRSDVIYETVWYLLCPMFDELHFLVENSWLHELNARSFEMSEGDQVPVCKENTFNRVLGWDS